MPQRRQRRVPTKGDDVGGAGQKSASKRFPKAKGDGRIAKPIGRDVADMGRGAGRFADQMQGYVGGGTIEEHEYTQDE